MRMCLKRRGVVAEASRIGQWKIIKHTYIIYTLYKRQKTGFHSSSSRYRKQVRHTQKKKWKQKIVFVIEVFPQLCLKYYFVILVLYETDIIKKKKKKRMCDGGLTREDVLCASRRWPKRHLHSAGPNGGQPVSGHLLLALLPLHHSTTFILCLFVFFPSL